MADALLTVSNLETSYGPIMAIRGVSFTVPERAIVTILGANGAGKTTILKTVSGAMDPQKGTVTFAGGAQQMLAISRALMARPRMMLLDEPSLGLAPRLVKEIFEIIARINRERGVTVLLVEQNANMALHLADYGYVLEVGRIVMEDTCSRLLDKEDIKEFYLGVKESGIRGTRRWKRKKTWR